jgi:transposase-like protein
MSKARLVITAVVVEGRSQSAVAREYGVSQGWISRLVTRYRLEGEAAFEPQSRRPHTSPTRLAQTTIDLIVELRTKLSTAGLDAGPTPSPGICNITINCRYRSPRSAATWPRPGW